MKKMKNFLKAILVLLSTVILTVGFLLFDRYRKNVTQHFPYPYAFESDATAFTPDAPILIVGDRMGDYFAKFKVDLASVISKNLAKPIKIESMAKAGAGLHRTIHELLSLTRWPQIVVYQGGSEEFSEIKFDETQVKLIKDNFRLYSDERVETAITLYPWLSRIIYQPMRRVQLGKTPKLLEEVPEADYMRRLDTELLLFEQQLIQLVNLSKDRNSLLILMTTPINLEVAPKRTCSFASNMDIDKSIADLKALNETQNYKGAAGLAEKLTTQYTGNADLFYQAALSAKAIGDIQLAKTNFLKASAFDCEPWRVTEVQNSLIRRVAKTNHVLLFDFARFVQADWDKQPTFFDDIYPQNLYYERGAEQLGLVIKEILKL